MHFVIFFEFSVCLMQLFNKFINECIELNFSSRIKLIAKVKRVDGKFIKIRYDFDYMQELIVFLRDNE